MLIPNFFNDKIIPEFKWPFQNFNFRLGVEGLGGNFDISYLNSNIISTVTPTLVVFSLVAFLSFKSYQKKMIKGKAL